MNVAYFDPSIYPINQLFHKGTKLLQIIDSYRASNQGIGVFELSNGEYMTIEEVHRELFHTNIRIINILTTTPTGRQALQQIFN